MNVIYKPAGRAQEYAESKPGADDGYALNIYRGCVHHCAYCYVPFMPPWKWEQEPKRQFHEKVEQRKGFVSKLVNDCDKMADAGLMGNPLHLCFTCDPYPPEGHEFTRHVLEILESSGFTNVQILTKGGMLASRDFQIMARNGWKFGSTIISTSKLWQTHKTDHGLMQEGWEPRAAPYKERAEAVKLAKAKGIFTWVSMEPVLQTFDAIRIIEELKPFVDLWKIGKINHGGVISPQVAEIEEGIDWAEFLTDVTAALAGSEYIIKKSLLKYG
jgi:DNA repair photolyase